MVTAGHLGGYRAGGDEATFYPHLWDWLIGVLGVRSMVDVGCGDGVAIRYFEERGVKCLGIEGTPQDHPSILRHDYTKGPVAHDGERFDLCWSCEFVEHVEQQYENNFLTTFECADLVLMTHAEPGQGGWHHVNCQPAQYWIDRMMGIGYRLDGRLTEFTRQRADLTGSPWNHYARSGLAFRREAPMGEHERMTQGDSEIKRETEREVTHTEETVTETPVETGGDEEKGGDEEA